MTRIIAYFSIVALIFSCGRTEWPAPAVNKQQAAIAFYNVENLFDTIDAPYHDDQEFLPGSPLNWDSEKYLVKLDRLSTVVEALNYPVIMGMAEVENRSTLEDLVNQKKLKGHQYKIAHKESRDHRGIDCAMIYKADFFELKREYLLPITLADPNYTGREVLIVEGVLKGSNERLIIAVTHWPSRRGGVQKTEQRRISYARQTREYLESNYNLMKDNILLMGDFNDEPDNRSIAEVLMAVSPDNEKDSKFRLYNMSKPAFEDDKGTYNFRGDWNMLDQMIVSKPLWNCNDEFCLKEVHVYKAPELLFTHPRYGQMPNRTAGGPNYYGGYSDHLPIYAPLVLPERP